MKSKIEASGPGEDMYHSKILIASLISLFFVSGPVSSADDYQFGSATFKTELWINNKTVFTKPSGVDVEFVTAGPFDWVIADAQGTEVKTARCTNAHGGWTSIDFASLGLSGDYSIGFRNASSQEQEIKQGEVRLK